jgi:ferredoxin-NADP reductase
MAGVRQSVITTFQRLSEMLCVLRLAPENGGRFPLYEAGQHIALRRDDCLLTKRVIGADGKPQYVYDLDATGQPKRGSVTHSYSIASAPFETVRDGHLEFYIVLERGPSGVLGRFTQALFQLDPAVGDRVAYFDRIVGDFTLDKRAAGSPDVVMVGTGTGVAAFVSMIKQLDHAAANGTRTSARYTLFYANRTRAELAYHEELQAIAAARRIDLLYVPSISRPRSEDAKDHAIGRGRANNLLRHALGMPLEDAAVAPLLPEPVTPPDVRARVRGNGSVVLTCGNASSMADIQRIAEANGARYEKEDWAPTAPPHN